MIAEREPPSKPPKVKKPKRRVKSRRPRSEICPNCGHPIAINYCPNCGQHAAEHNASVWSFVTEFFDEFLRLDSKFLRTMMALVLKPGYLTKEWCDGKRASYISPLKLYLTISALFFLGVGFRIAPQANNTSILNVNVADPDQTGIDSVKKAIHENADPEDQSKLDRRINQMVSHLHDVDPKATRDHFFNHISTASLILVPVSAFAFGFLYLGKKRYYLEHLVFMLHVSSFSFVTLGAAMFIPWQNAVLIAFLWNAGYLLFAIKKNYSQGWWITFFKFSIFGMTFFFLAVMAIALTAVAAAIMAKNSGSTKQETPYSATPKPGTIGPPAPKDLTDSKAQDTKSSKPTVLTFE